VNSFDELYKVHKNPWGSKPVAEIAEYADQFKPGSILDIGVGDGRNALFFAERGFHLTGLDISPEAITLFLARADELGVRQRVRGMVADISDHIVTQEYDNIISHYTLHFIPKEKFRRVIEMIQKQTSPSGINFITDFTQDGPLYKPTSSKYWLKPNELKDLYQGWDIIFYNEKPVQTRATDEQGNRYTQIAATLVARKPA
jgi:tellurite methyltransferase